MKEFLVITLLYHLGIVPTVDKIELPEGKCVELMQDKTSANLPKWVFNPNVKSWEISCQDEYGKKFYVKKSD